MIWILRQVSGFFVYFDSLKISGPNDGRLLNFHLLFNCSTSAHRWMWNRLRSVWPRYSLHHFLQKQQVMTCKLILRCFGSMSLRWLHSFGSGIKQKQSWKFWCPFIAQIPIYVYWYRPYIPYILELPCLSFRQEKVSHHLAIYASSLCPWSMLLALGSNADWRANKLTLEGSKVPIFV